MSLAHVALVAAEECLRQKVGIERLITLLKAFHRAQTMSAFGGPSEYDIAGPLGLAALIEPSNRGEYRKTPVTFLDGTNAINAQNIPRAMTQWWAGIDALSDLVGGPSSPYVKPVVDGLVKNFLDIHPFTDGNGRTAWLLRVWLLGQWDNPEPLPDYFGQS